MAPFWIDALYLLLAGLVIMAVVGWLFEESEHRRQVHGSHPKPIEPPNHLTTRCPSCFAPTVGPYACTDDFCATWKRDHAPLLKDNGG